jgi:hypothetical protein
MTISAREIATRILAVTIMVDPGNNPYQLNEIAKELTAYAETVAAPLRKKIERLQLGLGTLTQDWKLQKARLNGAVRMLKNCREKKDALERYAQHLPDKLEALELLLLKLYSLERDEDPEEEGSLSLIMACIHQVSSLRTCGLDKLL